VVPPGDKEEKMSGYCGACNTHYDGSWDDHEWECPGEEIVRPRPGSVEDFAEQTGRMPSKDEYYDNDLTDF
jgi:hypothetical protein